MNKLAIVVGTPSAGKTSLVESVAKGKRYKVMNLGDIMRDIGIEKRYIKDRDEIRYLSNAAITQLRTLAVERVSEQKGNVILDTHATVEQHGRFFPGLPFYIMSHLKHTVAIFYVDSSTKHLLARRKKDKSRHREIEPEWLIDMQRDINLAIVSYYSTYLNIPLYVIINEEGKLNSSIRDFKKHLQDAFGGR